VLAEAFLVLAESALELVPEECWRHPSVVKYAEKRGKRPSEVLLDRAYHHAAMRSLPQAYKRGRPDIIHFALLEALGSPLNKLGKLRVYVSTLDGHIIEVKPWVRLPRVYERFKGLVEQLYVKERIEAEDGKELLTLRKLTLAQLVSELKPSRVYLLSEDGKPTSSKELEAELASSPHPLMIVGGFPHGAFSEETSKLADMVIRLFDEPLETWVVVSRILCAAESSLASNIQRRNSRIK